MATKFNRVVTWGGGTQLLKSCYLLIAWSRDKLKILVSALLQYLWSSDLVGW